VVLQAEKIENVGIAENQVRSHPVFVTEFPDFHGGQLCGLLGKGRALEKHGVDFLPERPGVPILDPAHFRVKVAFEGIFEVDDVQKMGPAQFRNQ
jgi:hypothetical protein